MQLVVLFASIPHLSLQLVFYIILYTGTYVICPVRVLLASISQENRGKKIDLPMAFWRFAFFHVHHWRATHGIWSFCRAFFHITLFISFVFSSMSSMAVHFPLACTVTECATDDMCHHNPIRLIKVLYTRSKQTSAEYSHAKGGDCASLESARVFRCRSWFESGQIWQRLW